MVTGLSGPSAHEYDQKRTRNSDDTKREEGSRRRVRKLDLIVAEDVAENHLHDNRNIKS